MANPIERPEPGVEPESAAVAAARPGPAAHRGTEPEPVTPEAPRRVRRPLLTQDWLDLAFLHWETDPAAVARLLPRGAEPDLFEGRAYVGLIAFRMHRVGWLGLPGLPWIGSFPETNVRLYSVGADGRRGVVFRSLDASRLVPVLIARAGFRLPYVWARMSVVKSESPDGGPTFAYSSRRLPPGRARSGLGPGDPGRRAGGPAERVRALRHGAVGPAPRAVQPDRPVPAQRARPLAAAPRRAVGVPGDADQRGRAARAVRSAGQRALLAGRLGPLRADGPLTGCRRRRGGCGSVR